MTLREAFPDYPADSLPPIPPDWRDSSWRNDACPSFETPGGLFVYVDWADKMARDFCDDSERFTVMRDGESLLYSDDWAAVLATVAAYDLAARFADEMRRTLEPQQWAMMRERNATPKYAAACASHDFIDANEIMAESFGDGLWLADGTISDESMQLWNRAWDIAKRESFTA